MLAEKVFLKDYSHGRLGWGLLVREHGNGSTGEADKSDMETQTIDSTTTMIGRAAPSGEPNRDSAIVYLPIVIRGMLAIGIAFILLGTAIGLIRDSAVPTPIISFTNLPSMLANFDAAAVITLGILVCLITPATYILYMGVSYAHAHDRMYTLIAGIVFLIIMGSIVVAALSGASNAGEAKPDLALSTQIGILIVSAVAGVLGSMLGLGGGVFIVPILSAFFGIPLKVTIAASAVSVVVNSLGGTSVYLKHDMSNVRLGMVMELTTAVGAIIGGLIVVWIAPDALRVIFGVALLGMGVAMFMRQHQPDPITSGPDRLRLRQNFHDPSTNEDIDYIPQRVKVGVATGSLAGIISGMLGIGGGAVKVPIMNAIMRVPVKAAAATSVFMVGITVSASAFIYYLHNIIDLSVTVPAVLGVVIGSQTGARVSRHLKNVVLVRFLVLILVYLAVTLLLQAFGVNLPGTSS
jgi:uncharacterized membrane protein YfcA/uncharacterized membrane protein